MKTAILVDGGFYRRMAQKAKGYVSAEERAEELENYCHRHLKNHTKKLITYIEFFTMTVCRQEILFIIHI